MGRKRKALSGKKSKKLFRKTAKKMHRKNNIVTGVRGGYRI